MINPKAYADTIKDNSLEQLVTERNRLVADLQAFEAGKNPPKGPNNEPPDHVYQCNNLYLIEATGLLNKRFIELNWPEE
jgi:hypothetical protein